MERLSAALAGALEARATIVTASPRQSFAIHLAWARLQQQRGYLSWPTPEVLPLGAWLSSTWRKAYVEDESGRHPQLLSTNQERALWEAIVNATAADQDYLQPFGLARAALDAWHRLHAWGIPLAAIHSGFGAETAAFAGWAHSFESRTLEGNWIDAARALDRSPRPAPTALPSIWCCAGFDQLTPAERALLERLAARGVDARSLASPATDSKACKIALPDPESELRAVAEWASATVVRDPGARLLVVIPDLDARRAQVERIFGEILVPASLLLESNPPPALHAIDGGLPLARYPIVAAALTALQAAAGPLPFETMSQWLRSPFLAGATSRMTQRARLDLELREVARSEISLHGVLRWLERWNGMPYADAGLLAAGREFMERLRGPARRPSAWSGAIALALKSLGWPGERTLDSAEFQTVEKVNALLAEFATCDSIHGSIGLAEAAHRLGRLAQQTSFQPETGDRPILLTSRLVDPGLLYDGIWITGLHANVWPQAPRPDPFIPWHLQRAAGIPAATPEGMLVAARRVTECLVRSSQQFIASWPLRLDDETCRPSPLLTQIPTASLNDLGRVVRQSYRTQLQVPGPIEFLIDEQAPAFRAPGKIPGGSGSLSLQARCPFRAFGQQRLAAAPLRSPPPGVDAATRGQFVHRALELVWKELGSQAALQALEPPAIEALLERSVAHAAREKLEQPRSWPPEMVRLESARLLGLLRQFMAAEAARPAFRVIATEQRATRTLAGFELQVRLDRVDELAGGERILIDYKTGATRISDWLGERPREPQLPLYAVLNTPPPAAVAFATLNAEGCGFSGLGITADSLPGIKAVPDWGTQLASWRISVERLMAGFAAGDARVDPLDAGECNTCHLHALCRIDERRRWSAADEVDDG